MQTIEIEVVYATRWQQELISLVVDAGSTIEHAIKASGVLQEHKELVLDDLAVGVFGQRKALGDVLEHGDRVEIYRPLLADPKEKRRQMAARQKAED